MQKLQSGCKFRADGVLMRTTLLKTARTLTQLAERLVAQQPLPALVDDRMADLAVQEIATSLEVIQLEQLAADLKQCASLSLFDMKEGTFISTHLSLGLTAVAMKALQILKRYAFVTPDTKSAEFDSLLEARMRSALQASDLDLTDIMTRLRYFPFEIGIELSPSQVNEQLGDVNLVLHLSGAIENSLST